MDPKSILSRYWLFSTLTTHIIIIINIDFGSNPYFGCLMLSIIKDSFSLFLKKLLHLHSLQQTFYNWQGGSLQPAEMSCCPLKFHSDLAEISSVQKWSLLVSYLNPSEKNWEPAKIAEYSKAGVALQPKQPQCMLYNCWSSGRKSVWRKRARPRYWEDPPLYKLLNPMHAPQQRERRTASAAFSQCITLSLCIAVHFLVTRLLHAFFFP